MVGEVQAWQSLPSCLTESGGSRREKSVPAMMAWNQGKHVETSMISSTHEDKPAGDQLASPSAARPPYRRGVSAARVSRATPRASDSNDWDRGEAGTIASTGIASAAEDWRQTLLGRTEVSATRQSTGDL